MIPVGLEPQAGTYSYEGGLHAARHIYVRENQEILLDNRPVDADSPGRAGIAATPRIMSHAQRQRSAPARVQSLQGYPLFGECILEIEIQEHEQAAQQDAVSDNLVKVEIAVNARRRCSRFRGDDQALPDL